MKRRNFIFLLGGASSGAMSVGTGAFSSMEAERGVEVNVTDDKHAFVWYDAPNDGEDITQGGEEITLVRIQNQFSASHEIALVGVEIDGDHDVLSNVSAESKRAGEEEFDPIEEVTIEQGSNADEFHDPAENEAFGPGGAARVVADANLAPGQEAEIEVTVTVKGVEGTGITARIFGETRSFTIKGSVPDEIGGVTFTGARNANADDASGSYTLDLWFVDTDDSDLKDYVQQERSWNGSGNVNSGGASDNSDVRNRRLLAVRFQETGQTFYRPGFGISQEDVPWSVENFIEGDENDNGSENGNND